MTCIVCDGRGCDFCGAHLKVLAYANEERTPGGKALFDQEHAGAIEKLRGAHTFVLAYVGDDGIGTVVANCREDVWLLAACGLAEAAVNQCREDET